MPTDGFSIKPLKVKLLAEEQKATKSLSVQTVVASLRRVALWGGVGLDLGSGFSSRPPEGHCVLVP